MQHNRERIVILDEGADLLRETVIREPANDVEDWRGCGPERGEYETAIARVTVGVEYLPPGRRG